MQSGKWKVEVNEWATRQSRVARTSAIIQLAHPAISWLVLVFLLVLVFVLVPVFLLVLSPFSLHPAISWLVVLVLVVHYLYNLHLHICTIYTICTICTIAQFHYHL